MAEQNKNKLKKSLLSSFCCYCCCFLLYFWQPSQSALSAWPEPGCRRSFSKLSEMCILVSCLQLRADDKSKVTGTTPNQEPNRHASCFRHHYIPVHFACWVSCSPGYLVLWSKGNTLETPVALSECVSKQEKQNRKKGKNTCPFGLMAEYGIVLLNTRHGTSYRQSPRTLWSTGLGALRYVLDFYSVPLRIAALMEKDVRSISIPCLGNSLYNNTCTNAKITLRLSLPGYTTFAFQEEKTPKP